MPVGVYQREFYAGEPAVTKNSFGAGQTYYIGSAVSAEGLQVVFDHFCREQNIVSPLGSRPPVGVEVMVRKGKDGTAQTYVLNHSPQTQTVALPNRCRDLLTQKSVDGVLALPPRGVAILVREDHF